MRLLTRRRKVFFVFAATYRDSGSTVMRGKQLSEIARKYAGEVFHVEYRELDALADVSNSQIFLTKGALKASSVDHLLALRRRANRLFFDVVDEGVPLQLLEPEDVLVAASYSSFLHLGVSFPDHDCVLINHHVDPRVVQHQRAPRPTELRIGYFGELPNARSEPPISQLVDFVQVHTSTQDETWFDSLSHYNLHYAVRQNRELDVHKPFLKGFTAAHCDSPVVIQRGQSEAEIWLSGDYPYFVPESCTTSEIIEVIEKAHQTFEDSEWVLALEMMSSIRSRTHPRRIGWELRRALS